MERKVNLERNMIFHLEVSMIIYSFYNAQTAENLVNTLERVFNKTTWNKKLFTGILTHWFNWYLSEEGVIHYAINSILFINTFKEKYNKMYEKLIIGKRCMSMQ